MSVIRVKHQEKFVTICTAPLEDPSLSWKAKGLWAYCMSRPNDWEFHTSHLKTVSLDGRDSVLSTLRELIKAGYCKRTMITRENGQYQGVDYEIYETKEIEQAPPPQSPPKKKFPYEKKPKTEIPALAKASPLLNNDIYLKLSKASEGGSGGFAPPDCPSPPASPPFKKINYAEQSDEENIALLKRGMPEDFNPDQHERAINFYKRISWKVLAGCECLEAYVFSVVRKDGDLDRANKAFRSPKDSESARQAALEAPQSIKKALGHEDMVSSKETNLGLSKLVLELFSSKCLQGSGITTHSDRIEFFWSMGSEEILFDLDSQQFWNRLDKQLRKWGMNSQWLLTVHNKENLKVAKG